MSLNVAPLVPGLLARSLAEAATAPAVYAVATGNGASPTGPLGCVLPGGLLAAVAGLAPTC